MDQDKMMALCDEKQLFRTKHYISFCRLWLAYLFRRYDTAAEMIDSCQELVKIIRLDVVWIKIFETLYIGLTAAAMLRQGTGEEEKWRGLATGALDKVILWAEDCCEWNFRHKVDLLRAELAVADGEIEAAEAAYDGAIRGAEERHFFNEHALACERYGLFHLERGSVVDAKICLSKAEQLYRDWGAVRKADDVSEMMQLHCTV